MASLKDQLRNKLTNDTALAALLTGGWQDADTLPHGGGGAKTTPREANKVTIKPYGTIRWRTTTPKEIVSNSERRTVEFYLHQDAGTNVIEQAKRRLKALLHQKQVENADDYGLCMFHWSTDVDELPADENSKASRLMVRFYVDLTRKI